MNRIEFIKSVIGSFALMKFTSVAAKSLPHSETVELYKGKIHGSYYYDAYEASKYLKHGSPLTMKREPQNPFDQRAIALYFEDYKLGYVPKKDNVILSRLIDIQAIKYNACLDEITEYHDGYFDMTFKIFEVVKIM